MVKFVSSKKHSLAVYVIDYRFRTKAPRYNPYAVHYFTGVAYIIHALHRCVPRYSSAHFAAVNNNDEKKKKKERELVHLRSRGYV